MNERIKELLCQSHLDAENTKDTNWIANRFAELIIKECGQVILYNIPEEDIIEDWDRGYDRAMKDCIEYIHEHFGVKE